MVGGVVLVACVLASVAVAQQFFKCLNCSVYWSRTGSGSIVDCTGLGFLRIPTDEEFSSATAGFCPRNATQLGLQGNIITSIPPQAFVFFTALQVLDLSLNRITTISSDAFRNLSSLRQLFLTNNFITSIPEDCFAGQGLVSLESIDLSMNYLKRAPMFSRRSEAHNSDTLLATDEWYTDLISMMHILLNSNFITVLPVGAFMNLANLTLVDLSNNNFTTISVHFFSSALNLTNSSVFQTFVQGYCSPNGSWPCPGGTISPPQADENVVEISLNNNPIATISKTAFDNLPANFVVRLNPALPSCCGAEWILLSQRVLFLPGDFVYCNDTNKILSSYAASVSICSCKYHTFNSSHARLCYKLLNLTSLASQCLHGCPAGYTPYRTGSVLRCTDSEYLGDKFTLYETACQECYSEGCVSCPSSVNVCNACQAGYALYATDSNCYQQCPDKYRFDNSTLATLGTATCGPCGVGDCIRCDQDAEACTRCIPGYFVLENSICTSICPDGYMPDEQHGVCTQTNVTNSSSSDIPLTIILPSAIGGSFLLLAAGGLWYRFRRQHSDVVTRLKQANASLERAQEDVKQFQREWEINIDDIILQDEIGKGAYGIVRRGIWRNIPVAVKTVHGFIVSGGEETQSELDHEATMLRSVRHANIVQFYGAGTRADRTPFIVTELMELGSLTGVLRKEPLDWTTKFRFTREIAQGMALVHSLGSMHRDLKSGNVLVTASRGTMHVKVADFGTAKLVSSSTMHAPDGFVLLEMNEFSGDDPHQSATRGVGTPLWMAPEILNGETYGQLADLYSFGIVMWEIASQKEPWPDVRIPLMLELSKRLSAGTRPPVSDEWPRDYTTVMRWCWQTLPRDRPTFDQVLLALGPEQDSATP